MAQDTKKAANNSGPHNITIATRPKGGSAGARSVRARGMLPGVIYGGKAKPELIALDPRAIIKTLHRGAIKATLFVLDLNGQKQEAVVRDVQLNLLNELPTHIDFQRVSGDDLIPILVPVKFANADICPGIKNGGILTIVRGEVELLCRPHAIPDAIEVDLTNFKMGQAIKISHFKLPDGVRPVIKDRDFPVATIAVPKGMDVEEQAAAAGTPAAGTAATADAAAGGAAPAAAAGASAPADAKADKK
ncbi:MAG: 50S ribosomal protein L25/general stress protein Ctc [Alphaproteobacteria bacterium]|nr:50S ribosomal protein L25/general stress protein Ctc [Alphaproteobacteria bacterium]